MKKDSLDSALESNDYQAIGQIISDHPGKIRKLYSQLHKTDASSLNKSLNGFQIAAKVLGHEKILDIVRQLMWMLNEESGNNCPNAALALGHIAQVNPQAVIPHLPVLKLYAEDPSPQMRTPVRQSISMINLSVQRHSTIEN